MAATTVEEYRAALEGVARERFDRVVAVVRAELPDAEETIRYGMPAFSLGGRHHVHVAAWAKHLGIYPVYPLDGPLETEVGPHRSGADTLKFPYSREQPDDLIGRVIRALARG
jgi:uncharacterized protein YdhG (YjbR/CyaY superfamily)